MHVKLRYSAGKLEIVSFPNGRPCLLVGGDRVAVNVPEDVWPVRKDEVLVKDYSECEGALRALVAAGVVAEPHAFVRSGWVELPVCRLLVRSDSN